MLIFEVIFGILVAFAMGTALGYWFSNNNWRRRNGEYDAKHHSTETDMTSEKQTAGEEIVSPSLTPFDLARLSKIMHRD